MLLLSPTFTTCDLPCHATTSLSHHHNDNNQDNENYDNKTHHTMGGNDKQTNRPRKWAVVTKDGQLAQTKRVALSGPTVCFFYFCHRSIY